MQLRGLRTSIHHVRAEDLAAAKAWYTQLSGTAPYFDEPFYVGFDIAGFELGLDPDARSGQPGAGGTTVYWRVDSVREALTHARAIGAQVRDAARDVGGGIQVATVDDPFGNVIGFIEMSDAAH